MDIIMPKQLCKTALELLDYNLTLVENVEGNSTILQDLDKRKHWGKKKKLFKLQQGQMPNPAQGEEKPLQQQHVGTEKPGSSLARKALEC